MKRKKLRKYSSKTQNCPKFLNRDLFTVARPHKKWGQKTKNNNLSGATLAPGKEAFAGCQVRGHPAKKFKKIKKIFAGCQVREHPAKKFKKK
jgi:hypothetical protein